ncbi:hypothetical protein [Streptomyces sp. KAU_LT]|uniref:hypothetical protein n=1 Tax=Streptomyces sp. KAU_LT TaxID=3046669 RepID=UPI0024B6F288|nr:hypothetical protein [Streptomyces sp. KAU_LT]MDI9829712.1 hypothetical protein [Streptomyces sp. KAU_LT]
MTAPQPFKALTSYAYFRTPIYAELLQQIHAGPAQVFGDSGAHSARTLGITLTVPDYAQWCHQHDDQLTLYANLDVIGAPEATWRNQKELEAHGLEPIPVFHTGEPWHWLERYIGDGYTYIALGKLLGNPLPDVLAWLDKVFRIADGRAVFHGFGLTVDRALREFPFYSVDSSTWGSGFRFGIVKLFDDRTGRWTSLMQRDRQALLRHRDLIRAHHADPMAFASKATQDNTQAAVTAAVAWRRYEAYIRRRHGPVEIPPGPHNPVTRNGAPAPPGLHLYLAESTTTNLRRAFTGVRAIEEAHEHDHTRTRA